MKYLIFGDVHGNLPALEKLFETEKGNYDLAVCHGDVVNYGPWSNECVAFIKDLPSIVTLKGNHEENYLNGSYHGTSEVAKAFFDFCYPSFEEFKEISTYKNQLELKNFTIRHTIQNKYIFPDSDLKDLHLDKNYIIGHSHYQFDRSFRDHRLVNTGSLGQNRRLLNVAEYVLLDEEKGLVELKSIEYDIEKVISRMLQDEYPQICINYYRNKPTTI
ncbi:metallophosphoesterase family protein [Zunongwangia sp. F363]|uniref:Metallophosphoesterase family protein n=1 Tax=Autumnicola tepida TaxID=3075595 RepID=A0ABU3CF07_9FLAO|nr:metallophosphoesterase family protein [Zunongwangia sp. F363]MDT0644575.1 metallophosphoesterase family protein [Zunongwangia sp. F363]